MIKEEKAALTYINRDPLFNMVIEKLTKGIDLEYDEKVYILACAMLFLNHYNIDKRFTSYADFAYYIILKYSLKYSDYLPLFDFSINFGFYPIAKAIFEENLTNNNLISNCLIDIELDKFKVNKNYVETLEQYNESERFFKDESDEKSYLAPTSFGKSFLIVEYIRKIDKNLKIVIVVPTKSLLMQTYRMIREADLKRKIIIHDEMFNNEISFIAIFTQERALRLLDRQPISYDVLFIDEAHNILKKDPRSILLSRLITVNRFKNPKQKVIYLSPLIKNVENLKISEEQTISSHTINFNIKEPEIFDYRLNRQVYKYNRFVDEFYHVAKDENMFNYLISRSGEKNFIYNYRPIKIEQLASELCGKLTQVEITEQIIEVEKVLAKEVHRNFYAIKYLRFGLVYLHGKLPDLIKEYLEFKYKSLTELKYVIANSVILEGMNLPIDTLFIFNTYSLKGKELMNLIGRVNRLNEIFSSEKAELNKLLPMIHFINNEEHNRHNSNMTSKITLLRSRVFEDVVENPTLNSFDIDKLKIPDNQKEDYKKKMEVIQENERFINSLPSTVFDQLKKDLIESGINNYYNNVEEATSHIILRINSVLDDQVLEWTEMPMMEKIEYLFIHDFNFLSDFEVKRLKNKMARNYYEHFILVGQKQSLNENIKSQFEYFKEKAKSDDPMLYFGSAYGEEPYETESYRNFSENVYVNLMHKSDEELINLAVVKLKIEEDFVSFKLNKFIVIMFDYDLITLDEYNLYIYGTTDEKKISLTKYGLRISLISRLDKDGQLSNLSFDEYNNLIGNSAFDQFLSSIDDFYRFEISRYLN